MTIRQQGRTVAGTASATAVDASLLLAVTGSADSTNLTLQFRDAYNGSEFGTYRAVLVSADQVTGSIAFGSTIRFGPDTLTFVRQR